MDKKTALQEYQNCKDLYNRLGQNIVEALKTFLIEKGISFLDIYYRIKDFESFYEKIERKNYSNPFIDIEDICGIRVICYYAKDVEKINDIINKEFNVLENLDKSQLLGLKEFAYRSQHFIVKINSEWTTAPNYRKLENLKAEIQVRTILMHAWAEIEHKLNYKSDAQVPDKFQRKLFRLSAKFEEADEQFDELRTGIDNYKDQLNKQISTSKIFDNNQDFNLETFKAFLNFHFPDEPWEEGRISIAFDDLEKAQRSFSDIENAIYKVKPHFTQIVEEVNENDYLTEADSETLLWISMDIVDDSSYQLRKVILHDGWKKVVDKWKEKI